MWGFGQAVSPKVAEVNVVPPIISMGVVCGRGYGWTSNVTARTSDE